MIDKVNEGLKDEALEQRNYHQGTALIREHAEHFVQVQECFCARGLVVFCADCVERTFVHHSLDRACVDSFHVSHVHLSVFEGLLSVLWLLLLHRFDNILFEINRKDVFHAKLLHNAFRKQRISASRNQNFCFWLFQNVLQEVLQLLVVGVPLEALRSLGILEEL